MRGQGSIVEPYRAISGVTAALIVAAACSAALAAMQARPSTGGSARVRLVQADSADGWLPLTPKAVGKVAAGVMTITDGGMRTAREDFRAFTLSFDARATPGTRAAVELFGRSPVKPTNGSASAMPLFATGLPNQKAFPSMQTMALIPSGSPTDATAWHHYEITNASEQLSARLDGATTLEVATPHLANGWIGFTAQSGSLELRNVVVDVPSVASPRPVTPAATGPAAALPPDVVRIGGSMAPPRKTKDVKARYPADAMQARVQGTVILQAIIGRDGRVEDTSVVRSVPLLDDAAIEAVRQWEYTPTLLNGAPVRVVMTVTVSFSLQ